MTKKLLVSSIMLVGILFAPSFIFAETKNSTIPNSFQRGNSGEFVKDIQSILKNDSLIYPQGLVTGFYGPATEQAIKKLQEKYGLPQTGVVDSPTIGILFPNNVQLKVITPNGGEVFSKENSNKILWSVTVGPITANGKEIAPSTSSTPDSVLRPSIVPFFHKASIDLVKDSEPSFVYHVATVDLYQTQYVWKIPDKISNSSDYKIKISVGGNVPCLNRTISTDGSINDMPCPMWYSNISNSDTSDNIFSITGKTTSDNTIMIIKLKEMLRQMQQIINNLQNQLDSISQLISAL